MNNKEKIKEILMNELEYCYCYTCEYGNWDKYHGDECDNCYRKYNSWTLSSDTAAKIAEQIIKEVKIDA